MNKSLKNGLYRTFFQMLADLKKTGEIESFWSDFLGEKELDGLVRKLATLYWIKKGRDFENIKTNLGTTKTDFEQAKKILSKKGIRLAIKKIEAEEWANIWAEKIKKLGTRRGT